MLTLASCLITLLQLLARLPEQGADRRCSEWDLLDVAVRALERPQAWPQQQAVAAATLHPSPPVPSLLLHVRVRSEMAAAYQALASMGGGGDRQAEQVGAEGRVGQGAWRGMVGGRVGHGAWGCMGGCMGGQGAWRGMVGGIVGQGAWGCIGGVHGGPGCMAGHGVGQGGAGWHGGGQQMHSPLAK